jgi:cell division protein FtsL
MIRRKWRPKEIALGAAFLLALVGLLTFYVWYQTEAVHLGVAISRREAEIKALRDDIKRLELRKASLLSSQRVEKIARGELGLVDPKSEEIVYKDQKKGSAVR